MIKHRRVVLCLLALLGPLIPVILVFVATLPHHSGYSADSLKGAIAFGETIGCGAALIGLFQERGHIKLMYVALIILNLLILWPMGVLAMIGSARWT
jgi:hypothetical protein